VACQLGVEHGLRERPEQEAVVRRDEVDRPAHHDDPDDGPLDEQVGELLGPEVRQSRPEARVRVERDLRLHSHEVLDHPEGRHVRALEEVLAREGRPVELAERQAVRAHRRILLTA
jgi:hypothetical protein